MMSPTLDCAHPVWSLDSAEPCFYTTHPVADTRSTVKFRYKTYSVRFRKELVFSWVKAVLVCVMLLQVVESIGNETLFQQFSRDIFTFKLWRNCSQL